MKNDLYITPNKQKRQKVLSLLGAFAYLQNVMCNPGRPGNIDKIDSFEE